MREHWERTRWIAWQNVLLSPNIRPGRKPQTAKAFWTFPWEKLTPEEMAAKAEEFKIGPSEIAELNRIFQEIDNKQKK